MKGKRSRSPLFLLCFFLADLESLDEDHMVLTWVSYEVWSISPECKCIMLAGQGRRVGSELNVFVGRSSQEFPGRSLFLWDVVSVLTFDVGSLTHLGFVIGS